MFMAEPTGEQPRANTIGLVAMVLGILALPLIFCYALGLPVGIAAVVLGAVGLYQANRGQASNRNQALVGLACGAIAIIVMIVLIALRD